VVTAAWLTLVGNIALYRPPWGDERHYLETVRTFGRDLSVETLRTYPGELAPPLAFALYAGWGRLAGFEAPRLRLLSLVIAFVTVSNPARPSQCGARRAVLPPPPLHCRAQRVRLQRHDGHPFRRRARDWRCGRPPHCGDRRLGGGSDDAAVFCIPDGRS